MKNNLQGLFYQISTLLRSAGMLRIVFFSALLFSGISLSAQPADHPTERSLPISGNSYSGILNVNRDCEAPVLRFRVGQQLQLNFRSSRPGQPWNLQRSNHMEGKLLPEFCRRIVLQNASLKTERKENSSYHVYSTYTLPVRAGPLVSTTEQSFLI